MSPMESLSRDSDGNDNRIRDIQREVQFLKAELKDSEARYTCWKNVLTDECKDNELHFQGKLNASQSKFEAIVAELKKSVSQCRNETSGLLGENKRLIAEHTDQVGTIVYEQSKKVDAVKEELHKGIKEQSRKFSKENASIAQAFLSRINEQRQALESAIQDTQEHCESHAVQQRKRTYDDFLTRLDQKQQETVKLVDKKISKESEALQGSFEGGLAVLKDTMTHLFREEVVKQRAETEENFLKGIDKMERWLKSENSRRESEMNEIRQVLADQARELKAAEEWRLEATRQMRDLVVVETSRIEESLQTDRELVSDLKATVEEKLSHANDLAVTTKEETMEKTSKMVKECLMLNVQLKALENQCSKNMAKYETALEECHRTKEDMQQSFDNQNLVFQSYEDKILQHSSDFQACLDDHSSETEDIHSKIQDLNDDLNRLHEKVLDHEGMIETTSASLDQVREDRVGDNANFAKIGKTWESLYAHLAAELQDTVEAHDVAKTRQDESMKTQVDAFQSQLDVLKAHTSEHQTLSTSLKAGIAKTDEAVKSLSEKIGSFASKGDLIDGLARNIDEISTKVEDIRSDVQQRLLQTSEENVTLSRSVKTDIAKADETLKSFSARIDTFATKDDLRKGLDSNNEEISTKLENISSDVQQRSLQTTVDEKFADLETILSQRVDVVNQAVTKNRGSADMLRKDVDKCLIKVDVLQSNLGSINKTVFSNLQQQVTDQAKQLLLDKQERSFAQNKLLEIEETIDDRIQAYVKGAEFVSTQEKMREAIDSNAKKLSLNLAFLKQYVEGIASDAKKNNQSLEDYRDALANLSTQTKNHSTMLEDLETQVGVKNASIEEQLQTVDKGLIVLTNKVEEKIQGSVDELNGQLSHFIEIIKRLEQEVSSNDKNIEVLKSNLATIDKEFGVMLTSQIESRRDLQTLSKSQTDSQIEIGGFVSSYEQQLKELRNVIARLGTEVMGEVTKHLLAQKQSVKIESEAVKENAAKFNADINGRLESISSQVKGCFRASETKMRDILDSIEKDFESKFRKLALSSGEQEEKTTQLTENVEMMSNNIADLQATIEPTVAILSAKIEDQSRNLEVSRDEVAEVTATVEQLGSRMILVEGQNREITDHATAIDSKLTQQNDKFGSECAALEQSLRSYMDKGVTTLFSDVSEKALETNEVIEKLHGKVDASVSSCNQAVAEVNDSLKEVTERFDTKISSLHKSLEDGAAELLSRDVAGKQAQVEERIAKLDHLEIVLRELSSNQQQTADTSFQKISLLESAVSVMQQALEAIETKTLGTESNLELLKSEHQLSVENHARSIADCRARQEESASLVDALSSNNKQNESLNSVESGLRAHRNALIGLEVKIKFMEKALSRFDCSDIPGMGVELKQVITSLGEDLKTSKTSLDERMTAIETSVVQPVAQAREVAATDHNETAISIKDMESLQNGLARVEEQLEKSTRATEIEIAETKSIVLNSSENWRKSVDSLGELIQTKTHDVKEDVLNNVAEKCKELRNRIEKASTRSTLEAAILKKSVGLDLQGAQADFVGQLEQLEKKSSTATRKIESRVTAAEESIRKESATLVKLESNMESVIQNASQSSSAQDGFRLTLDSNLASTAAFKSQLEAIESMATKKAEDVAEMEQRLMDGNNVLAQRIGVLDNSLKDQRQQMDVMEQKFEAKATGLSERIEQVDVNLSSTKRSHSERMDIVEADSKYGMAEVRTLVDSSLKTALGAQEQVETLRLLSQGKMKHLAIDSNMRSEDNMATLNERLTEMQITNPHPCNDDVAKEAEGVITNKSAIAIVKEDLTKAAAAEESLVEAGADVVEVVASYSMIEEVQNSTLENTSTISIGGKEVRETFTPSEAIETTTAAAELQVSENAPSCEPEEELSEVVVVDKKKKKVTIQAPAYKNTTSKKRVTKARRGNLRNALKALCDDLKSDVIPYMEEERDTDNTCSASPEEPRESI